MKKTHMNKNGFDKIVVLVLLCLFLFNSGCGLETLEDVPQVPKCSSLVYYNTTDGLEHVFNFSTANEANKENSHYVGTEIYYKISNSYSKLSSEYSSIDNMINSDLTAYNAFSKLESFNYKVLKCKNYNRSPLIPKAENNQTVKVRLSNAGKEYLDDDSDKKFKPIYQAGITVDSVPINGENSYPVRADGNFTFTFSTNNTNENPFDIIPGTNSSEITDYYIADTFTEENVWYVAMYAVSLALSNNLEPIYSSPVYLGTVPITVNAYN